jgi:hypothetical protein
MKYTRMLCWVRPHEKKELKEAVNGQFPLVFAKNYDDFKSKIENGDYLVFSIVKAAHGFKKCKVLIQSFPDKKFYLYYRRNEDGFMTDNEVTLFEEPNVIPGQYGAAILVRNYLDEEKNLTIFGIRA